MDINNWTKTNQKRDTDIYRYFFGKAHTLNDNMLRSCYRPIRSELLFAAAKTVSFTVVPAGGVLCPNSSALQEVRNCNEHACTVYHWQTGPWGQCTDDPSTSNINTSAAVRPAGQGSCSTGIQTRKVICVRVSVGQVPPKK